MDNNERIWWESVSGQKWYVVVNDLVGGMSVSNVDKSLSQQDYRRDEYCIADFMSGAAATHIAELHNAQLEGNSG